jgi:hypothetical protein
VKIKLAAMSAAANSAGAMCLYYNPDCADPTKGCDLATSCMAFGTPDQVRIKTFADPSSGAQRLCMIQTTDSGVPGVPGRLELLGGTNDAVAMCSLEASGFAEPPAGMVCPVGSIPVIMQEGDNAGKIMCMAPFERVAAPAAPAASNGMAAPAAPAASNGMAAPAAPAAANGMAAPAAPAAANGMAAPAAPAQGFTTLAEMQAEMDRQRAVMRAELVTEAREEATRRMQELELQAVRRLEQERASLERMGMGASAPATVGQVLGRKPAMRVDMPDRSIVRYPPFGTITDSMDERLRLTQDALSTVATAGIL